ncbi:pyrroline-5-carboxylate reductase family protein [Brevundimonas sp.]|uniref:pyrroline-5-carboxylate reductase family protein n=1 Tax=Brevundimonas sp. TaxID=1871086 RepID=UPI002D6A19EF|nr:pyrroline-5-carboxylate reductase dimerization domain-containing protein [Brevundimonas sp.]HYD26309.1 pyrroline-5-carboxylate reductase dimerization domain-containing protein [Brevundimonas sp.]
MTDKRSSGAVVLVGCGRLGSAILEGWLATETVAPADLIVLTPSEKPAAEAARAVGAAINPPHGALGRARAVVLAVKPAKWRDALEPVLGGLPPEAVIVSVMAGVSADGIAALAARPVARVMPTTGVAQARGVAALWSADAAARETARRLFGAIADVVDLDREALMDAATAVAGSAPAFIHAFVQALARAGEGQGLSPEAAGRLARGALRSAGAGADTGEPLDALIARIASPGGTTRAGLDAMQATGDLDRAAEAAVEAAVQRAKTISG